EDRTARDGDPEGVAARPFRARRERRPPERAPLEGYGDREVVLEAYAPAPDPEVGEAEGEVVEARADRRGCVVVTQPQRAGPGEGEARGIETALLDHELEEGVLAREVPAEGAGDRDPAIEHLECDQVEGQRAGGLDRVTDREAGKPR